MLEEPQQFAERLKAFLDHGRNISAITIIYIPHTFTLSDTCPMTTPTATIHYPNRMGRIILLSMEEVMGRNGVNAILKLASLSSLIEKYPLDNSELAFSFSTVVPLLKCWSMFTVHMVGVGLPCELDAPASILGFVSMVHNWD